MRLRTGVGAAVVAAGVVAAVVLLRSPSAQPPSPQTPVNQPQAVLGQVPVVDARAKQLTDDFRHTTLLPATVHFADDPNQPPGFRFQRYTDTDFNYNPIRYSATGLLVRTSDNAALDQVEVDLWHVTAEPGFTPTNLAHCEPDEEFGGDTCTQAELPHGIVAMVMRDPEFARTVASDATTGAPSGLRTELEAAYPNGILLTITVDSLNKAGIPLDDAAMLRLATIPGIASPR